MESRFLFLLILFLGAQPSFTEELISQSVGKSKCSLPNPPDYIGILMKELRLCKADTKLVEASKLEVQNLLVNVVKFKDDQKVKIDAQEESINKITQKLTELNSKIESLTVTVHSKDEQLSVYKAEINTHDNFIKKNTDQLTDLLNKFDTLAENTKAKDDQLSALRDKVENQEAALKKSSDQIVELQQKVDHLQEVTKAKDDQLSALRDKVENQEAALKKSSDQIVELQQKVDHLQEVTKAKDGQLSALRDKVENQEAALRKSSDQIVELQQKVDRLEEVTKAKDDQLKNQEIFLSKNINQLTEVQQKVDNLATTTDAQKHNISTLRSQIISDETKFREMEIKLNPIIPAPNCLLFGDSNGIQQIKVPGIETFSAPCDSRFAGPGWTVIQRRMDGSVDFYRDWNEYREGFGNLSGEFWIGLEKLHRMTVAERYELYIHMEDVQNEIRYVRFDSFVIGNEVEAYKMKTLGKYSGNGGDILSRSIDRKFSTRDRNNDLDPNGSCAEIYVGAWWFKNCGHSNLNGPYIGRKETKDLRQKQIYWHSWPPNVPHIHFVLMMIRPKTS